MREGWRQVRLGQVTRHVIDSVELVDDATYQNLGVQWYGQGTFLRERKRGSDIKAKRLYRVRPGQFVYNRMFVTEGAFGLIRQEDSSAVASNEFPVFDVDSTVLLPDYLYLFFQRPSVWESVAREAVGTTKSRRRWKENQFSRFLITLPPLDDQRRIVDLIGSVDDAIDAAEASARALERALSLARQVIPHGPQVSLGSVLKALESGTSTKPVEGRGARSRMLTLAAIRPATFNSGETKDVGVARLPDQALLQEGDLLVTRSNTPDRVGYVAIARDVNPCTYIPDLVWRMRADPERVNSSYLEQLLSSRPFRSTIIGLATGTSQSMRKINKRNFSSLSIPLPDIETQIEYAAPLLEGQQVLKLSRREIDSMKCLRSNLLSALLSGTHEIPESYDELMETSVS